MLRIAREIVQPHAVDHVAIALENADSGDTDYSLADMRYLAARVRALEAMGNGVRNDTSISIELVAHDGMLVLREVKMAEPLPHWGKR